MSWVLVGVLALAACGGERAASRADVMAAMTSEAVPARFQRFADRATDLVGATAAWCDGDGTRDDVAEQVERTRLAWVSVSPFWFGPVMDRRSRFIVDPTIAPGQVDALLGGSDPLDATTLRNLFGADQRGLAAIEHLADSVEGEQPVDRECEYIDASAGLVAEEAWALAADWSEQGLGFGADDGAANDAIESMVNEVLFGLVTLENDPNVVVAESKLAAMRWAMLGNPTASSGNVEGIAPLLDDDVVEQLTLEFDAASGLAAEPLMELERTITTNVVSELGLSVQFSDADGDG